MCSGGSICDQNIKLCKCAADHHIHRGVCAAINSTNLAGIGDTCVNNMECQVGAQCRQKRCVCLSEISADGSYCSRLVEYRKHFASVTSPQPQSSRVAQRCPMQAEMASKCVLPDCFCSRSGREPPGGIPLQQLPQIVVLTFDDPVNAKSMRDYRHLFEESNLLNSNGCPVRGTFFVSHEWTNYNDVEWLARNGHELASNSISHRILTGLNYTDWLLEIDGQRQVMAKFANVEESQIVGMRAPQLGLGGDAQFLMAKMAGFLYDNSISVDPGAEGEPYWPQTLDYRIPFKCENEYCPRIAVPGLWAIPMNVFHGRTEFLRSPMLQGILTGAENAEQLLYYLYRNFHRAYLTNRAPFVLNLNVEFLQAYNAIGMRALESFLSLIRQNDDVYFMTMRELIDWMRAPVSIQELRAQTANCFRHLYSADQQQPLCTRPNKCLYETPALGLSEHQFLTCNRCPSIYPWTSNPLGIV